MRLQAELHAARDPLEEQQQQQQEEGKARPKQRGSSQQPFSGGEKLGEGGASESGDGNSSASDLKGRAVAAALLDQFSKLEREYDNYRAHAQRLFQDKDDAVATLEARLRQAQSGTAAATTVALLTPRADGEDRGDEVSGDDVEGAPPRAGPARRDSSGSVLSSDARVLAAPNASGGSGPGGHHASRMAALKEQVRQHTVEREYVKNTLLRYLCTGPGPEREPMEAALATALQFTKDDVRRVQDSRASLLATQAGESFTARWFGL
jgi:hypothetical protein